MFGIDATGPQGPFYDQLVSETRRRGMRIPFVPVNLQGDKIKRIEDTLEPLMTDGRLFVHPNARVAHEEGGEFPNGFLDFLDCWAQCHAMFPKRPNAVSKIAQREGEIEKMRRQGTPFNTIMERLAQRFGR